MSRREKSVTFRCHVVVILLKKKQDYMMIFVYETLIFEELNWFSVDICACTWTYIIQLEKVFRSRIDVLSKYLTSTSLSPCPCIFEAKESSQLECIT